MIFKIAIFVLLMALVFSGVWVVLDVAAKKTIRPGNESKSFLVKFIAMVLLAIFMAAGAFGLFSFAITFFV